MKKLYILITVLFLSVSCEKEEINVVTDPKPNVVTDPKPVVTTNDEIVNHFFNVAARLNSKFTEPIRYKKEIKIYFHSTNVNYKNEIAEFMNEIDSVIDDPKFTWTFVDDADSSNFIIIDGDITEYNMFFNEENDSAYNQLGGTNVSYDETDCSGIKMTRLWFNGGLHSLKHEILHGLGLKHSSDRTNIMYSNITRETSDRLTKKDHEMLNLLYHDNSIATIVKDFFNKDCGEDMIYLNDDEYKELKKNLYTVLENK